MSETKPLSPDQMLKILETHLRPFVQARRGELSIATSEDHLLQLLTLAPIAFRVIINWDGDNDAADGGDEDGIVLNHFSVVLSMQRGLSITPGDYLVNERGGQEPFLKVISLVRARVRSCAFPEGATFGSFFYKGCQSTAVHYEKLDKTAVFYNLNFDLQAAIEAEPET